jgi:hypothetical protein
MAIELKDGTFACSVCGEKYPLASKANACRDSHEMLYIPMTKTEVNRLMNAIILNQVELVPESVIETLRRYAKNALVLDLKREV